MNIFLAIIFNICFWYSKLFHWDSQGIFLPFRSRGQGSVELKNISFEPSKLGKLDFHNSFTYHSQLTQSSWTFKISLMNIRFSELWVALAMKCCVFIKNCLRILWKSCLAKKIMEQPKCICWECVNNPWRYISYTACIYIRPWIHPKCVLLD